MSVLRVCARHGRIGCECAKQERRPNAGRRGYGSRWRRFAQSYLRKHPFCIDCDGIATLPDHIDGKGPLGPRGYDEGNLRPMCASCHSKRTARDQPGGWNAR